MADSTLDPPARRRSALRVLGVLITGLRRWMLRVTLPVAGLAAMLQLFPYRGTAAGIPFTVRGTVLVRRGLSVDTTFGNWEFRHVTDLPLGLHLSPVDVDLLRLTAADHGGPAFVDQVRADVSRQAGRIAWWLGVEAVLGVLLGVLLATVLGLAWAHLRDRPRRTGERSRRLLLLAVTVVAMLAVAAYGRVTYRPHWQRESRLTGTLGAAQLVPDQLAAYYRHQSKFFDVIGAVAGIQAQLQQQVVAHDSPDTAYNIMFISDMHLAATYPLVQQYAANFHVRLIINSGDETEFGQTFELTPSYRAQLAAITRTVPMIWIAGNHDSPDIVAEMSKIPGVTVLGDKRLLPDGSYAVRGAEVSALGLTIAGVSDPRVYGAPGAYGADTDPVTDPLEKRAVDNALRGMRGDADIFITHEPVAARQLVRDLGDRIRETVSGHLHAQNRPGDIQRHHAISLVEGSAGAGGLDNINRNVPPSPVEFSVESVSGSCQFVKLVRFQLDSTAAQGVPTSSAYGEQVSATTVYLEPQRVTAGRACGTDLPISPPTPLS